MSLRLATYVCALVLCAGCGKKADTSEEIKSSTDQARPANGLPAASVAANSGQAPAQGTASPQGAAPAPAAVPNPVDVSAIADDTAAVLGELTQALRRYGVENRRVPASLEEVVSAGYIKALPPAPPGKKYAINPKRVEVVLEKR